MDPRVTVRGSVPHILLMTMDQGMYANYVQFPSPEGKYLHKPQIDSTKLLEF